jgi:hypothetical protein
VQPRIFLDVSRMPRLLRQDLEARRWIKSSGMETFLFTDLKCDALAEKING